MGALDKVIDKPVALHLFYDQVTSPGTTTVAAATIVGATAMTLAAASVFSDGDYCRIGSGETQELAKIASGGGTTSVVWAKGLQYAHAIGEAVVEQNAVTLGKVETAGFKFSINGENVDVKTMDSRLAYGKIPGYFDLKASWSYPTVTTDSIANAFGVSRSLLVGSGTNAAQTGTAGPRLFTTDGSNFGGQTGVNAVLSVQRKDGTYASLHMYNLTVDPTSFSASFARGQLTTVPVSVWMSGFRWDDTNALFAPAVTVSTYAPSKSDIFNAITAVQTLTDSGTATTTTAIVAANAYVVPVTSATGIAAGGWIKLGTGDSAEWHKVFSVATLNVNLYTQVQAAFASGVAVTVQTITDVAGVVGGFNVNVSGSGNPLRSETSSVSLGYNITDATVELSTEINSFTTANLMLALGMPSAALTSSVLSGTYLGTDTAKTLLFTGTTQGAKNLTICGWDGAPKIALDTTFTISGESRAQLSFAPRAMQVFVNA